MIFAYGPADATAIPSSLASLKYRLVQHFWCRLYRVVFEKRSLNESKRVLLYRRRTERTGYV